MSLEIVNEGSTAYLTITFKDKNGNEETPSSATYRIDCLTNGQTVLADTVISPIASSVEIELSADDNAIISSGNALEKRLVTVSASYGAGDAINSEYRYNIKNLSKI